MIGVQWRHWFRANTKLGGLFNCDSRSVIINKTVCIHVTVNAVHKLTSCGRAPARILAWTNFDLSVECVGCTGVYAYRRAGVDFPSMALHVHQIINFIALFFTNSSH